MPATYLSHQAPVVALKLWRPAWFDGTALVVGSMVPDWPYVLHSSHLSFDVHSARGVLLVCTPVAVLVALLVRWIAPAVAAQLPVGSPFPTGDLALLAVRPALSITLTSAFVGAASHVLWDEFTHPDHWAAHHIAWFREHQLHVLGHDLSGAQVLQQISSVLGAVVCVVLLARIRRRDLLRSWAGFSPAAVKRSSRAFWLLPLLGLVIGCWWGSSSWSSAVLINRVVLPPLLGLAVSGALSQMRRRSRAEAARP